MSSNSASNASTVADIILPDYNLLPATMLKGLEDAAQSTSTSSDISGDFFNSNRATKEPIANLRANDVIMVTLFVTENAVPMDSTALAQGPLLYLKITGNPQTRVIFATCLAYSQGTVQREIVVGSLVYFTPPDHILVANTNMLDFIETSTGTASDEPRTGVERANKRFCTRMQAGKGEQPAYETSIDKGMSKVMFDLDGVCRARQIRLNLKGRRAWICVQGHRQRAMGSACWQGFPTASRILSDIHIAARKTTRGSPT
jgi:hypothetical protein